MGADCLTLAWKGISFTKSKPPSSKSPKTAACHKHKMGYNDMFSRRGLFQEYFELLQRKPKLKFAQPGTERQDSVSNGFKVDYMSKQYGICGTASTWTIMTKWNSMNAVNAKSFRISCKLKSSACFVCDWLKNPCGPAQIGMQHISTT